MQICIALGLHYAASHSLGKTPMLLTSLDAVAGSVAQNTTWVSREMLWTARTRQRHFILPLALSLRGEGVAVSPDASSPQPDSSPEGVTSGRCYLQALSFNTARSCRPSLDLLYAHLHLLLSFPPVFTPLPPVPLRSSHIR